MSGTPIVPNLEVTTVPGLDPGVLVTFDTAAVVEQPVNEPANYQTAYVEQAILLSFGTKAVCTDCGREDAPFFYLKRSHGFYEMLCRLADGSGCWPNSPRTLCRHIDQDQVQCTQLAEYKVTFGGDQTVETESCCEHLGRMVAAIPCNVHYVYPLED
jgi:hypothetical protein